MTGNATVGHLILLKEAIRQIRSRGKTAYEIFLDVQKAYDKAWLDAILYTLKKERNIREKSGNDAKNEHRTNNKNQNERRTHKKITIKDSIRQGCVLSVIEYATLMNEITKEIQEREKGIKMENGETLANLLWMDDVALIHEETKQL